jgi:enoyl-CoA hydratase/carnithine racemase
MSDFTVIIYEKKDGVGYVTLNRPDRLNAYNIKMRDELYEVLSAIEVDPDVKVVIFKGAGEKAFCAGADLSEFLSAESPVLARKARFERDIWGRFMDVSKPIIAAMQGYVLGSGIEISLYCDIRICTDDSQFGLPEIGLGIIPAAGGTQTLPRMIGRGPALDILLSGRWMKAAEAKKWKLVNQVVPRAELLPTAQWLADKIKSCDPLVIRYVKQAIKRGMDMTLAQGLAHETKLSATVAAVK